MAGPIDPRLWRRAEATRKYLVASVVVGILTAVLIIAQAQLIAEGVVTIFTTRQIPFGWPVFLAVLLAVFTLRGLLGWVNSVLAHRSAAAVKSTLRRDIMAARLTRPTTGPTSSSSVAKVVTTGLDDLDGYFSKYLPQLGLAITVPFIVGLVVLLTDWSSAFIIAFTLPLIPLFMVLIGWTTQKATARSYRVADRLTNHFADLIEGLPTLQAFARAQAQRRGIELNEEKYRASTMRVLYVSFLSAMVLELLASLSVAVVAVTVGFRLVYGAVDFYTALFVLILAPEAYLPVRQVGVHFHDSVDGVAAADAAFEIIDGAAPHPGTAQPPEPSQAPIRWESATYTYPGAQDAALRDFTLELQPGEVVALSGTSGGGKSTALAMLMGFVTATGGRVLAGGVDLADADLAAWRRHIAFVSQNPGMLNGTVADNVRLGAPEATDEQLDQALREAGADFDASKSVGDDGEGLSGGERRRVAMARALLRIRLGGASLLVLDEPTAGLDSDTEAGVLRTVRASGAGALIVTHRPAVLAAADRAVVLEALR